MVVIICSDGLNRFAKIWGGGAAPPASNLAACLLCIVAILQADASSALFDQSCMISLHTACI